MKEPRLVLWLFDDDKPAFWREEIRWATWSAVIAEARKHREIELREITGFKDVEGACQLALQRLDGELATDQHCIVTDAMFASTENGGQELIELLSQTPEVGRKLCRSVVCSDVVPIRIVQPGRLMHVKRFSGAHPAWRRIIDFILHGTFAELADLMRLVHILQPLAYFCDSMTRGEGRVRPGVFPQIATYGIKRAEAGIHFFDPLLQSEASTRPFAYDHAYLFSNTMKELFQRQIAYAISSTLDRATWDDVELALCPWHSLGLDSALPSAIRVVWEAVMMGVPPISSKCHPLMRSPALSVYERIWIRRQLDSVAAIIVRFNEPAILLETCRTFSIQYLKVQRGIADAINGGERIVQGDL